PSVPHTTRLHDPKCATKFKLQDYDFKYANHLFARAEPEGLELAATGLPRGGRADKAIPLPTLIRAGGREKLSPLKLRIIARRNDANEGTPKHSRPGRRPDSRRRRQHGPRHRKPPRDPATR